MGRKKRIWYPGAIYHVMSRGNRRTMLYKEPEDYLRFLECIAGARKRYPFKLHSLCLMTNHFHMAIETADVELGKIMQRILHPYSMDFNEKYDFTGHLFESRYVACLIEDERYFMEVSRYIHLNPVKARIVNDPLAYEYSSYGKYISNGLGKPRTAAKRLINELVDTDRVLGLFDHSGDELYRNFVEAKGAHEEQEQRIQKDIKEDELWLPAC